MFQKMNKDLKFEITLSTQGYDHKPNSNDYKMMKWSNPMSITLDMFDVFISKGYSYCHIYRDNRRCINNFLYTYVVNIDIDDSDIPMTEYIDGLTQKPTYAYTTCSNGIKGYRFRLIYVFNEKLGTDNYKSVYQEICTKNNIILNDNCGYSIGQLMNGNGLGNIETYKSYNIYSLEDFGIL